MNIQRIFASVTLFVLGLSPHVGLALSAAQDSNTQASPAQPSTQTNPADKTAEDKKTAEEKEREIQKQEQSQRMLKTLPNFATTNRREPPPLTPAQKFHLFRKSAFDPVEFGVVGMQAGISQAEDEFPEYGQGAAGFGKRYGATLADEVSSSFFGLLLPCALQRRPALFSLGRRIDQTPAGLCTEAGIHLSYRQGRTKFQLGERIRCAYFGSGIECLLSAVRPRIRADHEPQRDFSCVRKSGRGGG